MPHRLFFPTRRWRRGLALALLPASAWATPEGWVKVDPSALAALRGGFATAHGLQLALGIEQLASINGQLVAHTELALATAGAGSVRPGLTLVQQGSGNLMQAGLPADATGALVIQNSLNDQRIDAQTIISASVNSGTLIESINFQAQLSDALARAATAR